MPFYENKFNKRINGLPLQFANLKITNIRNNTYHEALRDITSLTPVSLSGYNTGTNTSAATMMVMKCMLRSRRKYSPEETNLLSSDWFIEIFGNLILNGVFANLSCVFSLHWEDANNIGSTLVQVIAWCRRATNHYLRQCWPRSVLAYGVTRPQLVNMHAKVIKWIVWVPFTTRGWLNE